jgi:putative tryptophan/tyrosine transport system substrate-binding protein
MAIKIARREFIFALGGLVVTCPLAARAQQPERMRRICILMGLDANNVAGRSEAAALKRGLQELGWTAGRNLEVKYSWSATEFDLIQSAAKELVGLQCEVIVARGAPVVSALLKETHTIPIVFTVVADPIGRGFVQSTARPGGNVTGFPGFEFAMAGKWLQLLKEITPQVRRIAYMYNQTTIPPQFLHWVETTAPSISVQVVAAPVHDPAEIVAAIAALARESEGGLVVLPDIYLVANSAQIADLAAKYSIPAIYPSRTFVIDGGLMSYGPNTPDLFYRAAGYVDRILKGEKPADLPIQEPTKYELVINLKVAKSLGLTVPPSLLATADEVME